MLPPAPIITFILLVNIILLNWHIKSESWGNNSLTFNVISVSSTIVLFKGRPTKAWGLGISISL